MYRKNYPSGNLHGDYRLLNISELKSSEHSKISKEFCVWTDWQKYRILFKETLKEMAFEGRMGDSYKLECGYIYATQLTMDFM